MASERIESGGEYHSAAGRSDIRGSDMGKPNKLFLTQNVTAFPAATTWMAWWMTFGMTK